MTENKTFSELSGPVSKYLTHTVTHEPLLEEQLHLFQMLWRFKQCAWFGKNIQSLLEGISKTTEMCQFN